MQQTALLVDAAVLTSALSHPQFTQPQPQRLQHQAQGNKAIINI
jgi:hypothetical protein